MNIKINVAEHKQLQNQTILTIPIGSDMYNMVNKRSDKDVLCIYRPTMEEVTSVVSNHHQFQYYDEAENCDYIYTSIPQFFRNLINGDSTINFEAIHTEEFKNHPEFFRIYDIRKELITYNIIKAYLGLVKRDLSDIKHLSESHEKWGKLAHAVRGTEIAKDLINKRFDLGDLREEGRHIHTLVKNVKNMDSVFFSKSSDNLRESCKRDMESMRKWLQKSHQNGKINSMPNIENIDVIDRVISATMRPSLLHKTDLISKLRYESSVDGTVRY